MLSAALLMSAGAQAQTASGYEKKNYNYSEWTKGLFSEVVTVVKPGKMIFLAGVGAEDEGANRGVIRHLGDFDGQCRYAYEKIKKLLAAHGATMNDVVKVVTYVTDIRNQAQVGKCRAEALAGAPQPVHTFLNINQLAWPGMLVEMDVIAITRE
jgi:enamine deaminase RidA (YjgF/YER057c/UK114 family)